MAIGWWGKKRIELSQADLDHLERKCGMYRRALQSCVKANAQDPSACNRLDTRLAECYAEDVCPLETAAFQTCYHKVGTLAEKDPGDLKGRLKERGIDCEAEATAMKRCLRDYKLYPFALDAAKKASK